MSQNPSFLIYSASMIVLCLNVLGLWVYSGVVRNRAQVTPNPEDIRTITKSAQLGSDPPEIQRVLRAHRNAVDNIVPFALLGLLLVLWGASPLVTGILTGVFTAARLGHSLAYLGEKQPWRTISFAVGALDTVVLVVFLAKAMITGA
ncbi:MAG: MAPEG family protein [Polyangiaceae bacterium]